MVQINIPIAISLALVCMLAAAIDMAQGVTRNSTSSRITYSTIGAAYAAVSVYLIVAIVHSF